MDAAKRFGNSLEMIRYACGLVGSGLQLEFGVFSGTTINEIAAQTGDTVYGFDSFEGLPEDWRPGFAKGTFARTDLPPVAKNVELVVGWFNETLENFLEKHPGAISLLHVDCDLYSSTVTIFEGLKGRIIPGTIIVFDEYFNYPGWQDGEYKAFSEFVSANNLTYKYIGIVPSHQKVAVEILSA